jgi:hypothetical protein
MDICRRATNPMDTQQYWNKPALEERPPVAAAAEES